MKALLPPVLCVYLLLAGAAGAAASAQDIGTTHQRDGYTLVFRSDDPGLDPGVKTRLIETFFTVYPAETRDYDPSSPRRVTFSVETGYHGVAATAGGVVHFSADYLHAHPQDIDVVTHEVMHIVQGYTHPAPGWLTEGIADYARNRYGVDNAGGGWSLPDYRPGQNYTDSYRITARFLTWAEKNGHPRLVERLDAALRAGTYTADTWKTVTGQTVDELWSDYARRPAL